MSTWYYADPAVADDRQGPVSADEIRSLLSVGTLHPHHLVWREGMSNWVTAGSIEEFAVLQPSANGPAAAIAYYTGGIPPRALTHLRGYAQPRGDVGQWPLDDVAIEQLRQSARLRKKVSAAAQMFGLFAVLSSISTFFVLLAASSAVVVRGGAASMVSVGLGTVMSLVSTALYIAMWYYTKRNHRWAPLTFIILMAVFILFLIVSIGIGGDGDFGAIIALVISIIFMGLFAWIAAGAVVAIPKLLSQPAWCQEAIVVAKL